MEPVQVYGPGWWVFVFCKWWMTAEAFLVYPFMSITQLHQSIPRQCSAGVKFNQISTDLYANFASRIWKENRLYAVFFHSPLAWCSPVVIVPYNRRGDRRRFPAAPKTRLRKLRPCWYLFGLMHTGICDMSVNDHLPSVHDTCDGPMSVWFGGQDTG